MASTASRVSRRACRRGLAALATPSQHSIWADARSRPFRRRRSPWMTGRRSAPLASLRLLSGACLRTPRTGRRLRRTSTRSSRRSLVRTVYDCFLPGQSRTRGPGQAAEDELLSAVCLPLIRMPRGRRRAGPVAKVFVGRSYGDFLEDTARLNNLKCDPSSRLLQRTAAPPGVRLCQWLISSRCASSRLCFLTHVQYDCRADVLFHHRSRQLSPQLCASGHAGLSWVN